MPFFKKKPVQIEAILWTGDNLDDIIAFTGLHPKWNDWFSSMDEYREHIKNDGNIYKLITLEGSMKASPGDWIIKGIAGEFYPCKPDIFEKIYDTVML